jgi:hypothetical protein
MTEPSEPPQDQTKFILGLPVFLFWIIMSALTLVVAAGLGIGVGFAVSSG